MKQFQLFVSILGESVVNMVAKFGAMWANNASASTNVARIGSSLARTRPCLVNFGQFRGVGPTRPKLVFMLTVWPNSANFARIVLPKFEDFGELGPNQANFLPVLADFGRFGSNFDHTWPPSRGGYFRPNLEALAADRQLWQRFSPASAAQAIAHVSATIAHGRAHANVGQASRSVRHGA